MPKVPILVISLAGAEQRRSRMCRRMQDLGLEFEFTSAVDGRSFDVAAHPAYDGVRRRHAFGRDLTGGELGCLLSHRAIFERMIAEQLDQVLVLEDDVLLSADFPTVLTSVLNCPLPYDMVRFLGDPKTAQLRQRRVYPLAKGHWLSRLATAPGGAYAYLVRLSGARKLLPFMQRNWLPVDSLMGRSWEHGLQWFMVQPVVTGTDPTFESQIGGLRFDKNPHLSGAGHLIYPMTRALHKMSDAVGKRTVYWSTWPADRRALRQSPKPDDSAGTTR